MDFSAPHAGFVTASYVLSAVLLIGLVAYVLIRDRNLRAEAARLDAKRHRDTP